MLTKKNDNEIVVLLVYIDDLLITESSIEMINELKVVLTRNFKVKDLGDLCYILGIEVARNSDGIVLNQRKYCLELIYEYGLSGSKPVRTPMEVGLKLTTKEYDRMFNLNEKDIVIADVTSYKRLIGKLLYLTVTIPPIVFCVHHLSQYLQQPKQSHMDAAIRVVKHLKNQRGLRIVLPSENNLHLTKFCDLDWAVVLRLENL